MPDHLKDANRDAVPLGHGKGYDYPHVFTDHHIGQGYLPDVLWGTYFYNPSDQGYEREVESRLTRWREAQRRALDIDAINEITDLSEEEIEALKRQHRQRRVGPT